MPVPCTKVLTGIFVVYFMVWFSDRFFPYIRTLTFAIVHCLVGGVFIIFFVLDVTLSNVPEVRIQ